jgi:hypothetical protein
MKRIKVKRIKDKADQLSARMKRIKGGGQGPTVALTCHAAAKRIARFLQQMAGKEDGQTVMWR